jgi:hypothetical protein
MKRIPALASYSSLSFLSLFIFSAHANEMMETTAALREHREESERQEQARNAQIKARGGTPNDPLCPFARSLTSRNLSVEKTHDPSLGGNYGSAYGGGFSIRFLGLLSPSEITRLRTNKPLLECLGRFEYKEKQAGEKEKEKAPPAIRDLKNPHSVGYEYIPGFLAFAHSYRNPNTMFFPQGWVNSLMKNQAHLNSFRFAYPVNLLNDWDIGVSATRFPEIPFDASDFASIHAQPLSKAISATELEFAEPHTRQQIAAMLNDPKQRVAAAKKFMEDMNKLRGENVAAQTMAHGKKKDEDAAVCATCKTDTELFWSDNLELYKQIVRPFMHFDSSASRDPARGLQNLFNSDPHTRLDDAFAKHYDFVRQCLNPHRPRELSEASKDPEKMTPAELSYEIHRFMATYDYFRTYNQIRNKYEQAQIELFQHSRMATAPSTVPGQEKKRSFTTSTYVPVATSMYNPSATGTTYNTTHVPYTTAQQLRGFTTGKYEVTDPTQTESQTEVTICHSFIPSAQKVCQELARAATDPNSGCVGTNPLKSRVDALEAQIVAIHGFDELLARHNNLKKGENLGSVFKKLGLSDAAKDHLRTLIYGDLSNTSLHEGAEDFSPEKYLLEGDTQGLSAEDIANIDVMVGRFLKSMYLSEVDNLQNKDFFLTEDIAKRKRRLDTLFGAHNQLGQGRFFADLKISEERGQHEKEKPITRVAGYRFANFNIKTGKFYPEQRAAIEELFRSEAHERAVLSAETIAEMNVLGYALAGKPQETNWVGFKQSVLWTPTTTLTKVLRGTGGVEADPGFLDDIPAFVDQNRNRGQAQGPSALSLEVAAGFNALAASPPERKPAATISSKEGTPAQDPAAAAISEALKKHDISSLCRQNLRSDSHQSLIDTATSADLLLIPLSMGTYGGLKVATRASLATYRALQNLKNLQGVTRARELLNFFRVRNAAEIAAGIQHSAHIQLAARLQRIFTKLDYVGAAAMPVGMADILTRCGDSLDQKVQAFDFKVKASLTHGENIAQLACQENALLELQKTEKEYIGCAMGTAFSLMMLPYVTRTGRALLRSPAALRLMDALPEGSRSTVHNTLINQMTREIDDRILESDGHFFLGRMFGKKAFANSPAQKAAQDLQAQLKELQQTGRVRVPVPDTTPPRFLSFELDPLHTSFVFRQVLEENPRLLIDPHFRLKLFEHIKNAQSTMRSARQKAESLRAELRTKTDTLLRMPKQDPNRAALEANIDTLRLRLQNEDAVSRALRNPVAARNLGDEMVRFEEQSHARDFVRFSLGLAAQDLKKSPDQVTFEEYFEYIKPFFNALYSLERQGGKSRWYYNIEHYYLHPDQLGRLIRDLRAGGRSASGFSSHPLDLRVLDKDHAELKKRLQASWKDAQNASANRGKSPAKHADWLWPTIMASVTLGGASVGVEALARDRTPSLTNPKPTPYNPPAPTNTLLERSAVPAVPQIILPGGGSSP